MLKFESVVSGFFRSIDLLILVGLAVWLFVQKVLPSVRKKIVEEHAEEQALAHTVEDLRRHAAQLDTQLVADQQDIERLEQKIRLWQQAIKRKVNRDATEKEDILVRLHKQDEQRAHMVRHEKFYTTALLEATDEAEKALVRDTVGGKAAVDKVVGYMASHTPEKGSQ